MKEYESSPGPKKLSKVEQAKADDPEHYELNKETGRYGLKEGWTKKPDGSFVFKSKDEKSPKEARGQGHATKKPAAKPAAAKKAEVTKPGCQEACQEGGEGG